MIISWPSELVSDIARRRSVLVLGAGISRHARNKDGRAPKMWREFLQTGIDSFSSNRPLQKELRSLLNECDYLTACQLIKEQMGNPAFHKFVKDEYLTPGFKPAQIHEHIQRLDSRIVATPNFDRIYEATSPSLLVKNYYDADVADTIRGSEKIVIKIHGTIDSPHRMIFTRTEYANARNQHRNFYDILSALAVTHTFIFLGCGLADPDIRLLLEDYAFRHNYCRPHYFVVPRDRIGTFVLPITESCMNLKILTFNPRNDCALLPRALDELAVQVDLERRALRKSGDW